MARRKQVEPSEHAPPAARIGGKIFRGAGAPVKRKSRLPLGPDGYLVVPDEIIDMKAKPMPARPTEPDPYTGEL